MYTDQALPIERCPQFRDQEPGSSATYNGKSFTARPLDRCRRQRSLILPLFNGWKRSRRNRQVLPVPQQRTVELQRGAPVLRRSRRFAHRRDESGAAGLHQLGAVATPRVSLPALIFFIGLDFLFPYRRLSNPIGFWMKWNPLSNVSASSSFCLVRRSDVVQVEPCVNRANLFSNKNGHQLNSTLRKPT